MITNTWSHTSCKNDQIDGIDDLNTLKCIKPPIFLQSNHNSFRSTAQVYDVIWPWQNKSPVQSAVQYPGSIDIFNLIHVVGIHGEIYIW